MQVTDTKLTFDRATPAAYVGPGGEVRVKLSVESDWWATFDFGVDLLRVAFK